MAAAVVLAGFLALPAVPAAAVGADATASPGPASGTPQGGTAAPGDGGWVPDGSPVHGAPQAVGAPLLTAGQDYRDTLAKDQVRYYAVRLAATGDTAGPATAYLSVFAVPATGSHVSPFDGLTLHLLAPDGTLCDYVTPRFTGADDTAPVGGVVRRPGVVDSVCRTAGTYVLQVQRDSAVASGADVWPLDLRYVAEPALAAPPAAGPAPTYSAAPAAPPAGRGTPVTGAASMDGTGTRLPGPGVYRDTLGPGETRYYRVPVGWGQRLLATASFGASPAARAGAFVADGLGLALYSPVRGAVDAGAQSWTGHAADLDAQTPVVLYANRGSGDTRVHSAALAGYYYVAVTLHPALASAGSGDVPVTLRLQVTGSALPAPHYAADPSAGGLAAPGRSVASPGATAAGGSGSPAPGTANGAASSVRRPVAWGAFGAAGVLTVWPTVLLVRRRRTVSR